MNNQLFQSPNELLASISPHAKGFIIQIMLDAATTAHSYFINKRMPIVHPDFSKSIDSRNLNASLNSAFHSDYLPTIRPFDVSVEKLNSFGQCCSRIEFDDIIMHIGKIGSTASLPPTAKYKQRRASYNVFASDLDGAQACMFPQKYYVVIGYRLNQQYELAGVDLIVPNRYYSSCLLSEDLLQYKDMRLEALTKQPEKTASTTMRKDKKIRRDQEDADA